VGNKSVLYAGFSTKKCDQKKEHWSEKIPSQKEATEGRAPQKKK
jgi:hypothetical protein